MFGLNPHTIKRAIYRGDIERPQFTWPMGEEPTIRNIRYRMSEDDVYKAHDFFSTYHAGRPRQDGFVTRNGFISRSDLRGLINGGTILYVEDPNGNLVPVWKEQIL